jgi:hypothetical protein
MARRKSGTAAEHNAETESQRQAAADNSANVVDLMSASERWEMRQSKILELAKRLDTAVEQAAGIRDVMKSIRLDAKSNDIDWKALSQLSSQRRAKESKRLKWEASRREIARAFGWEDGEQLDLLDRADGLIPGLNREFMGPTEDGLSPDKKAALESGFFTREELGLPAEA